MENKSKIVSPGEKLGVIEEYMPGSNTYEDDGKVISSVAGKVVLDAQSRKVGVSAAKVAPVPEVGDVVEGIVTSVREENAQVKIVGIRGKRLLSGDFSAQLHVSQAAKGYVKSMFDAVNLNDRILAKVTTSWAPYQLSTAEEEMGVIFATCTKCGEPLLLKGGRLYCKRDNIYEKKKVSRHYLLSGD
uniref:Exosome complex component Csl4 n=1 Tax=Candidatus Methanomethylicus mesodigestus TaxID=1867258 RepID=A0A7C3F517_9CREN